MSYFLTDISGIACSCIENRFGNGLIGIRRVSTRKRTEWKSDSGRVDKKCSNRVNSNVGHGTAKQNDSRVKATNSCSK